MGSYDINTAGSLYVLDSTDNQPYPFGKACERASEAEVRELSRFQLYCVRANKQYYDFDEWKSMTGITKGTIKRRLQNGWEMLDAVNTPGTGWRASPGSSKSRTTGRPAQLWECGTKALTIAQWSEE